MYAHCGCALVFSPFKYSPLPLYLLPVPVFQQLSIYILISSTFTSYGMRYYWCSIIPFSILSFPEFHRVVLRLQTCFTTAFVYDHACFCVYVYLWICPPRMRENMHLSCFWSWLTSLNMMSSSCIHLPSNPMSLFLVLNKFYIRVHRLFYLDNYNLCR
jgi:hypothetical protein